jgi:hypothetical protein
MNTEFDELLRDGMARFTAELRAPANLVARASRKRRQRLTVRTAASGVAAMTAAGITFAALPATTAPLSTGIAQHSIPERFDLEHVKASSIDKTSTQAWIYHERLRVLRATSGRPTEDVGSANVKAKNGHTRNVTTIVDYRRKEWARGRSGLGLTTSTLRCHPAAISLPESAGVLPGWIRGVHKLVKCGDLVVSGTAQINGIQTVKLTTSGSFLEPPIKHATIWVKRSDYVPVRIVERLQSGTTRVDLSWLQPTKPNLAMLEVPIPASFRKVPFSQLDGRSSESGPSVSCSISSSHPHKQTCTHSG